MKNSYVVAILGLYRGIFKDIAVNLPTVRGLERDESRLLSTVECRGIRYLTIDMPAYGKHFDKCLAAGRLVPSGLPNFGWSSKGSSSHRFLGGLMSRVFDKHGLLLSQPCITSIFFLRQLFAAAKKIKVDCTEKVREQSLQNYLWQESSLRSPSLVWHGDRFDVGSRDRLHLVDVHGSHSERDQLELFELGDLPAAFCDTVHSVADRIFSSFGYFDPGEWRSKHGPGAVADAKKGKFKYDFPTWSARLETVYSSSEFAYANYGWWADAAANDSLPLETEVPSVALTVPKSQVTPRIIAKEPIATMWCQQMLRDYLEAGVRDSFLADCIAFRNQSFNQEAALKASLTQSHWTVDLSSASDRLSLWLIERLLRSNVRLLEALWSARSVYCRVDTLDGPNYIRMKKFAPQGSATTFPLQTIVYATLAIAAVLYARKQDVNDRTLRAAAKEVRIFGDDTIIPSDAGRQYVELLTYCGFLVNSSKTFTEGFFRESCGVEAYNGVDVTPAYITYPYEESDPSSVASTVECSNNFFKKGLWHAAAALEETLPRWMRNHLNVVGPGDGAFGLNAYSGIRHTGITRYNRSLQRHECLALSVSAKVSRTQPGGAGHLLQYFTEAPTPDIHWMSGVDGRAAIRVGKRWGPLGGA